MRLETDSWEKSKGEKSKNWHGAAVQKRGLGSSGDAYRH